MPPSPWLSARITNTTYLIETMTISDHTISDKIPSTAAVAGAPLPAAAVTATLKA